MRQAVNKFEIFNKCHKTFIQYKNIIINRLDCLPFQTFHLITLAELADENATGVLEHFSLFTGFDSNLSNKTAPRISRVNICDITET